MIIGQIPRQPRALFLSHGGGPLPVLGDPTHEEMVDGLRSIAAAIDRPEAIIVVSAHWEEAVATITAAERPQIIYDYYGFPPASYEIQYPAPGHPGLADRLCTCLHANGIAAERDAERGFDHGLFIPLKIMYPEADISCIQLSLLGSLDPAAHLALGAAMSEMRRDGVLVIGSGFSFHNLKAFFSPDASRPDEKNEAFERWLIDTCSSTDLDEAERTRRLLRWEEAPHARYCHPREEHLLPLHVCYGMMKRAAAAVMEMRILDKKASLYLW
jgi:aromatic ring-opening dioxygenase catalytic subunit (LigB family)